MAELVGAFAATHGPLIAREWERLAPDVRDRIEAGFGEVGARLMARRPDVLIVVSPDHWVNFFIDNYPAFCVGIGAEHDGPPEPFLKKVFPHAVLPGHARLGRHILDTVLDHGGDPSFSHRLRLDHGFCLPLWRMGLAPIPPIVPVVVNEIEAPMPTMRRCLQWGHMLRQAIDSFAEPLRVAILATGGLSHYIGEPGMGQIDEDFDRTCIAMFQGGDEARLAATLQEAVAKTGNGGDEVRNWVVAHGAAGGDFDLIAYDALPDIYVGCAFAEWRVQPAPASTAVAAGRLEAVHLPRR
jgi:aromatic ring-opening dioxygenase catalytic subunit (LigB family)